LGPISGEKFLRLFLARKFIGLGKAVPEILKRSDEDII
jgi:hypothetical protein